MFSLSTDDKFLSCISLAHTEHKFLLLILACSCLSHIWKNRWRLLLLRLVSLFFQSLSNLSLISRRIMNLILHSLLIVTDNLWLQSVVIFWVLKNTAFIITQIIAQLHKTPFSAIILSNWDLELLVLRFRLSWFFNKSCALLSL